MWKGIFMAYFKVLSLLLCGGAEVVNRTPKDSQLLTLILNLGPPRYKAGMPSTQLLSILSVMI
jgi:hypothetical protein